MTRKNAGRKKKAGVITRFFRFVAICAAFILGAFLATGWFIGEDMPFIGWFFELPMLFYALGSLLLAVLFAAIGLRWWILLPAAELALSIYLLQPRFNSFVPVPENVRALKIMTWNVNQFNGDLEEFINDIKSMDPDILFLQEFRGGNETALRIKDEIFKDGGVVFMYQNAVFSRFPLEGMEWIEVHGYRSILKTTATIEDDEIDLYCVHFPVVVPVSVWHLRTFGIFGEAVEKQRIGRRELMKIIDNAEKPFIIAGDFNAAQQTILIRTMQKRMQDSFLVRGAGLGHTFDTTLPLIRIDYIFLSKEFEIYSHDVPSTKTSDHFPVVIRASIRKDGNSSNNLPDTVE